MQLTTHLKQDELGGPVPARHHVLSELPLKRPLGRRRGLVIVVATTTTTTCTSCSGPARCRVRCGGTRGCCPSGGRLHR